MALPAAPTAVLTDFERDRQERILENKRKIEVPGLF